MCIFNGCNVGKRYKRDSSAVGSCRCCQPKLSRRRILAATNGGLRRARSRRDRGRIISSSRPSLCGSSTSVYAPPSAPAPGPVSLQFVKTAVAAVLNGQALRISRSAYACACAASAAISHCRCHFARQF